MYKDSHAYVYTYRERVWEEPHQTQKYLPPETGNGREVILKRDWFCVYSSCLCGSTKRISFMTFAIKNNV